MLKIFGSVLSYSYDACHFKLNENILWRLSYLRMDYSKNFRVL